jgi:hypothetical protein
VITYYLSLLSASKKKPAPSKTSPAPGNKPASSLSFTVTAHNADQAISVTVNYSANKPNLGFIFRPHILRHIINLFHRLKGKLTVRDNAQGPFVIVGPDFQPFCL